jgi:hypothetical protein
MRAQARMRIYARFSLHTQTPSPGVALQDSEMDQPPIRVLKMYVMPQDESEAEQMCQMEAQEEKVTAALALTLNRCAFKLKTFNVSRMSKKIDHNQLHKPRKTI